MILLKMPVRRRSLKQKMIDALIQDAEKEKQQQLASAAIEIEKRVRLDPAIREWAVEGVVRCVCKQP